LPIDGIGNDPRSAYSLNELYSQLGELSAKQITVFMDACFSGAQRGDGMLMATVSMPSTTANQVKLLRAGFKLTAIAADTPNTDSIVDANSITETLEVAPNVTIEAGDAVMILDNGKLAKCTNVKGGAANNTSRCVGIAVTGATGGEQLQYMIVDTMTLPIAGGVTGQSLYINAQGKLQPVTDIDAFWHGDAKNPGVNFLQKVGTILTGSKIQVAIEPAVRGTSA
jgi:hypothetical protein